jgi:cysteinyl-tRNA synthetase
VTLYVCGITPYDYAHVGHGRCYITFDVLYRLLRFCEYDVKYCRNFTDIDDKLLMRAQAMFGAVDRYSDVADMYIAAYHDDMQRLNCLQPTYEPRVTEYMPQIIAYIATLVRKGHAYQVGGNLYFHIATFPAYGALSKHKLADLCAGARVDVKEEKRDPLDFALWKEEASGTFWRSPWGYGRPGWHIECSVLAQECLGDYVDIHAGGLDLVFPHHENEIAQSEALLGHEFGRYWMHNGFVQINKEKMSKSVGNFFTLRQLFEQFDPMVVRYYLLTHHYRAPMEFSINDLVVAQKSYRRLCRVFEHTKPFITSHTAIRTHSPIAQTMLEALYNDLNTPALFGILFEAIDILLEEKGQLAAVAHVLHNVLGLTLEPIKEQETAVTPEIELLLQERENARKARDWKKADQLRAQLELLGVVLQDRKIE